MRLSTEVLKPTLQSVLQLSSKLSLILHSERSLGGVILSGSKCLNLGPILKGEEVYIKLTFRHKIFFRLLHTFTVQNRRDNESIDKVKVKWLRRSNAPSLTGLSFPFVRST